MHLRRRFLAKDGIGIEGTRSGWPNYARCVNANSQGDVVSNGTYWRGEGANVHLGDVLFLSSENTPSIYEEV